MKRHKRLRALTRDEKREKQRKRVESIETSIEMTRGMLTGTNLPEDKEARIKQRLEEKEQQLAEAKAKLRSLGG